MDRLFGGPGPDQLISGADKDRLNWRPGQNAGPGLPGEEVEKMGG
jgi:hypothetical protein